MNACTKLMALTLLASWTAWGGAFNSDFNSGQPPGTASYGTAFVDNDGGVNDSGVLKLTRAYSYGDFGWFIIGDIDAGQPVTEFHAQFKLLIRGGEGADGFSFNFANDLPENPGIIALEEGFGTGLSVAFDTFGNWDVGESSPTIDLKFGGQTIASKEVPLAFMRTGDFIDVIVDAFPDSLDLTVNGAAVFSGAPLALPPTTGRFGLAARTGGLTDNHWVDNLSIVTGPDSHPARPSLEASLNTSNLVWTTGGSALWTGRTEVSHDGIAAARSGRVSDNHESWLRTTVQGPGTIAFWWKVSSEGDADLLEFNIDAKEISTISGGVNWQRVAFPLPAGSHTLKWSYSKDSGVNSGLDAGFLDEVVFVPDSGAPILLVDPPPSLIVITGLTATLKVNAGGDQALSYQWWFNETNLLADASTSTLTLNNVALENAGYYQAVVANAFGSVTSAPTLLMVTNLGPVTYALLLVDGSGQSAYETALSQLAIPHQRFTTEGNFAVAIDGANPASVLAIVDSTTVMQNQISLVSFVQAGGRAILQYWNLSSGSPLARVFGASYTQPLLSATSLYDWSEGLLYSDLSSPISFTDLFASDGVRLTPGSGASALAGFTATSTTPEAGLLAANGNRTLLNGFLMEEVSSGAAAVQLARNEITHLSLRGPPQITAQPHDRTVLLGAKATFAVAASANPAPAYQWFFNDTNVVSGASGAVLSISEAGPSHTGSYRVVVTNIYGAVTSSPAFLVVVANAQVQNTLLLVDGTQQSVFETALTERGQHYQRFDEVSAFNSALALADPASTLAIVDVSFNYVDLTELANFASVGGRSILEYWALTSGTVAAAFNASVAQIITAPPPLWNWDGIGVFAGLPNEILMSDAHLNDGCKLQPDSEGKAVAGYTQSPRVNEAAIVLGNGNRSFVNGFLGEDITNTAHAMKLAANEIDLLCSDPAIFVQPKSQTGLSGGKALFEVMAGGTPPLFYQWCKDGNNLAGATLSSLLLSNLQLTDQGNYRVVVSNANGVVTSSVATLHVIREIEGAVAWWSADGNSLDRCGTNHGTLLNGARFTEGMVGQAFWFDGNDDQFSATTTGLPTETSDRTLELWVRLDAFEEAGESFVAGYGGFGVHEAAYALTIVSSYHQPFWTQWGDAIRGGRALQTDVWYHMAAASAAGFTRLYLDGSEVASGRLDFSTTPGSRFLLGVLPEPGETPRGLRGAVDEVTVYNRALSGEEIMAIYSAGGAGKPVVAPAPVIITAPQTQTAEAGSTFRLHVLADGAPPLNYQWFFNSTNALGSGTNRFLDLPHVQPSQAGAYTVVVSNHLGSVTSAASMLSVIPPVPRRVVPALNLTGEAGILLELSYANALGPGAYWQSLDAVTLTSTSQIYLDLSAPLPPERFYRAWQTNVTSVNPSMQMSLATEIPLAGAVGTKVRIDFIQAVGPTDAWVTLDTVTLTNTMQSYFDATMFQQPTRLYRIVPVP
jgi:hypothetical protein